MPGQARRAARLTWASALAALAVCGWTASLGEWWLAVPEAALVGALAWVRGLAAGRAEGRRDGETAGFLRGIEQAARLRHAIGNGGQSTTDD